MPKNIVICLDGTGREFGHDNSNVATTFRLLEHKPGAQIAYYDPGVGTMGDPAYKTWIARKINKLLGLAFGRGLRQNVIEAYTYLMEHYQEGDKVFLFGFSRGAYTARALAALIKECGLLPKGSHNMIPYAIRRFRTKAPKDPERKKKFWQLVGKFKKTYGRTFPKPGAKGERSHQLPIEFLGLFDTVKRYGWLWDPKYLRNETSNSSVKNARHALAIDERRSVYRQLHWISSGKDQCKEVWFVGSHSDIGGGFPELESGLAKIALQWMIEEARSLGLKIDEDSYKIYALGKLPWRSEDGESKDADEYCGPDPTARAHESLRGLWWLAQFLPRDRKHWEEHRWRRTIKNEAEREGTRPENAQPLLVHESVLERMRADPGYRPWNLYQRDPRFFAELLMDRGELPEGGGLESTVAVETDEPGDSPAGQTDQILGAGEDLAETLEDQGFRLERTRSEVTEERVREIVNAGVKTKVDHKVFAGLKAKVDSMVQGVSEAGANSIAEDVYERLREAAVSRRKDVEAELMAGDLYQAIPLAPSDGAPSDGGNLGRRNELEVELRGSSDQEAKEAISRFLSVVWEDVDRAVAQQKKAKLGPEWELLRDQLWQGLLQRKISSPEKTGEYELNLKRHNADRRDFFVKTILALIDSHEYKSKLALRIDERLSRDGIAELLKQAPTDR